MRNALLRAGLVLGLATAPATAFAQKALVYCPPQDQTGCTAVVTALTGSGYPGGVDRAYDGTGRAGGGVPGGVGPPLRGPGGDGELRRGGLVGVQRLGGPAVGRRRHQPA